MGKRTDHASAVLKAFEAGTYLAKAKLALDEAQQEGFGQEATAALAVGRTAVNDGVEAVARMVEGILVNEREDREKGTQRNLYGPTADEGVREAEQRKRRRKAVEVPQETEVRYQVFHHLPADEYYAVRLFAPAGSGEAQPTGIAGPHADLGPPGEPTQEALAQLEYDANPDLMEWLSAQRASGDFVAVPPEGDAGEAAEPEPAGVGAGADL